MSVGGNINKKQMKKIVLVKIFLTLFTFQAFCQEQVKEANFQLANNWTVQKQFKRTQNMWTVPNWVNNGDIFTYKHIKNDEYNYFLANPEKMSKYELFNRKKLCVLLEASLDTTLNWEKLDLNGVKINSASNTIIFNFNDIDFEFNTENNTLAKVKNHKNQVSEREYILSPDERISLLIRDNNLFCFNNEQSLQDTIQITSDGEENYDLNPYNIYWSPDSKYIAFIREDWRTVKDLWLINHYKDPRPALQTYKWPMPGEDIEQYELWIFDTEKNELIRAETEKWTDQTLDQIQWSPDSKSIYFQRLCRDWKNLDFCSANPSNGECVSLIEERGKRQIITKLPYHILESTGEIIRWSWKDGWNHYYLYDINEKSEIQITKGNFNTGQLIHIDEENRVIYFMGNAKEPGRNPYYHHLYSVELDGKNLSLLSPEDAEHEIYFSPTGKYFVDNYSRADLAPKAVVRNLTGKLIMELEDADITPLEKEGWKKPIIFHVKAADDSTEIWGVMYKPYDFDPAKRYPIITYGYPGKETEFLPWKFCQNAWVTAIANSLAQYGFIVIVTGNRGGSPERSYNYYNYGENDFRDYPIADKKTVVQRLAAKYSFIDIDRVGIMGQSSGGFMAATAILLEPDFFKVAVAKCGPQDPALYYHHWVERYANVQETIDSTSKVIFSTAFNSNNQIVNNLKGRLLLIQGDMDLHVPPSLTFRLAYDLMMANKRFDMFIIPKADHFWGDNYPYVIKYMELYFVENLMGDVTFDINMFKD
jgi:dipeptidyl aminopeptidase/acylaminoacyl peptidase